MDCLEEIRRTYSEESIFLLRQFPQKEVEAISSGSLMLDAALGVGGIPMGRYTEIFGIDGSGKTTLCQHIIANAQEAGLTCAFIDVENAVDPDYAQICGVNFDTLYMSQPDFAEEALGIAEILIRSGEVHLIVIDSIAALSPEKESEDKFQDKPVTGMHRAKLLNVFFRRTASRIRKNNVAVVMTNQMRDVVGSFFGGFKPPGGHGLKHYASVRIRLSRKRSGELKSGGAIIGQDIDFSVVKNKVGSPYINDKFTILFGYGIDMATDIATCAATLGILGKRGAYYVYDGETIAQGRTNAIAKLRDNVELLHLLREECKEMLKNE